MYVASVPVATGSCWALRDAPLGPSPGYQGSLTRDAERPTLSRGQWARTRPRDRAAAPTLRRRPDATASAPPRRRPFARPAAATGPQRPSGAGRNATEWPAAAAAAKLADVEKDAAPC